MTRLIPFLLLLSVCTAYLAPRHRRYHRHRHASPYSYDRWQSNPPRWHPSLLYDQHTRDARLNQIVSSIRLFFAYKRHNPFDWRGIEAGYKVLAPLIAVSSSISLPETKYRRYYQRYLRWKDRYYPGYRGYHVNRYKGMQGYMQQRYGGAEWRRHWRPWEDERYLTSFGEWGTLPVRHRRVCRHCQHRWRPRWMHSRRHRRHHSYRYY